MALIKKIRERTGLAIGFVAIALMLFIVGGDIMSGSNSVLFGQQKNDVGEIAGETVSIDRFRQEVEERKYNFTLQQQRNPTEAEMYSIRQQAWELLIVKIAFQEQFEELGIEVTEEELVDMVQGNNIHPEIAAAFANPETGEVDRDRIIQYLQMIDNQQLPPQQIAGWYLFENDLRPSRLRIKYDNLITNSNYVTTAEAKNYYQNQNTIAEVDYLYIPYTAINDSLINISESDLRNYLRENSELYQVEEHRSIEYVTFPIVASGIDSVEYREEMADLKVELAEAEEDSLFARRYSDATDYFNTYSVAQLPEQLRVNLGNLSEGDVRGPYLTSDSWVLYKVSEIMQDTVNSARASHILVKPDAQTDDAKAEARRQAQDILNQLRRGASFDSLARQFSDDPSASRGGDLGWFTEGQMVEPFEEAVFNSNEGLVNRLVETTYGFHIIKVTQKATNKAFRIASVTRNITPSDATRNDVYQMAARFANRAGNLKRFEEVTDADSITVYSADDIYANDRRINNIANGREIVRWMYNEANVGDVSPIFETDDEYVVAALTDVVEEGLAPLAEVEQEIREEVKKKKQGELIIQRLSETEGTLEELAETFPVDANVGSTSSLKLSDNSLPAPVGLAPEAVGAAFALEEGQRTSPIEVDNGIVIVELEAVTEALAVEDYSTYKDEIRQRNVGNESFYLSEVIKEFADIEDKRYRFY